MKNIVFIFTAIVLIIVGIVVTQSGGRVTINRQLVDAQTAGNVRLYIGIGLGSLGFLFLLVGMIGMLRGSKQKKVMQAIMQNGIPAEGSVTFVDKNWTLLVNHKPIYSIVEYTYKDSNGVQHKRKINNVSSDMVIRMGLQVGGKIPIKYSPQNPTESVIILSGGFH